MALTDITRPYEVLIRYREDGSIAVHRQEIREIRDNGITLPGGAILQPPEPLSVADLKALVASLPD
ncbi:hypothetical protein [Azospirillum sp. sgz302134]